MHTQRGIGIFGFIIFIALTAAIVWGALYLIQRPLPKEAPDQNIAATTISQTVPAMTAPLVLPDTTTSTTTASSTMRISTSTSISESTTTATTTKKTTTKKP